MRTKLLVGSLLLLLLVRVAWGFLADRHLITVHADKQPLSSIIRSIEKQGGIRLLANFDATTPVTLNVDKVPLAEALESLAAVTDSRWQLTYVAAPDRSAAMGALAQMGTGDGPENWVTLRQSMPRGFASEEVEEVPLDPRRDRWEINKPAEATLKAYLDQASANVNASFLLPADWNPALANATGAGEIASLAPKLIKKAGGQSIEVFFLLRRGNRSNNQEAGGNPDVAGGGGNRPEGGTAPRADRPPRDPAQMEARMEAEIAKLPAAEQPAARTRMEERRKFWEGLRDLPEEERRAKMVEYMSDPTIQARRDERQASRESRQSPEQRRNRYERYTERRAQATGGQ